MFHLVTEKKPNNEVNGPAQQEVPLSEALVAHAMGRE
jgi:hypothetical protein